MATRQMSRYRKHLQPTCDACGFVPSDPRQLDIHHIDFNVSNNAPENLRTLCANCHRIILHPPKPPKERFRVFKEPPARFLLRMPTDLKVRLTEEADARLISLNALIVEKLSNGQPRALAQPARADEPEPLVKSRVTVSAPKADIPPKVVPKIAGLKPASELPLTAICKCGHAANKHYQREGACVSCEKDEPCRSFRPV